MSIRHEQSRYHLRGFASPSMDFESHFLMYICFAFCIAFFSKRYCNTNSSNSSISKNSRGSNNRGAGRGRPPPRDPRRPQPPPPAPRRVFPRHHNDWSTSEVIAWLRATVRIVDPTVLRAFEGKY